MSSKQLFVKARAATKPAQESAVVVMITSDASALICAPVMTTRHHSSRQALAFHSNRPRPHDCQRTRRRRSFGAGAVEVAPVPAVWRLGRVLVTEPENGGGTRGPWLTEATPHSGWA